jgi:hypothetical protein
MSSRKFAFVGPEKLRAWQEIFDMAWQEINALDPRRMDGDNASWLRNELAAAIISAGDLEPTVIKEEILQKIRFGSFRRRMHAA